MRKKLTTCLCLLALSVIPIRAGNARHNITRSLIVNNEMSRSQYASVKKDDSGVTLETETGLTRVEIWSDRVIRVLHGPERKLPPTSSLAVIARPARVGWRFKDDGDHVLLITPKVQVRVEKATGAVRFLDEKGAPILAEAANGTSLPPATAGGASARTVRQQFELDTAEAIYGLGQHQEGAMNRVGTRVHLQQKNAQVAVPVLLSSKGYAVLWDNPAVTDVNVGAGREEVIPTARLFDEEGQPGGLTARYYQGRNFDTLVATRSEPLVDFDWSDAPPPGLPHDNYSVRWTGFVEAQRAGEYAVLASADDGVRVWIDDQLLIEDWNTHAAETSQARVSFAANSRHRIRMEYFQGGGGAVARLAWRLPLTEAPTVNWNSEAGRAVDYYFMYGPEPDQAIAAYRALTGAAPMMARWTWGYWQCRERYSTQEEILGVVAEYRKRGVPLDGIIQDWQYWEPGQWGSHAFDPKRYPDPTGMVETVHRAGAHIIISVWPRFDLGTANLAELEKAGAVYPPVFPNVYPRGQGKWYDPFSPVGRRLYWKQLSQQLHARGFDGWWLDASEAELGGKWGEMRDLKTAAGPGPAVLNAYPLMHTTAVYEGQRAETSAKRVLILTRSAYAGQQRNAAVTWSGDIRGSWEVYRRQIPAGLNFAATGIPYWNTDIGGFFGGDPADPKYAELFTRWFQYGAFCPMFRVHGTGKPKEIWRFDDATQRVMADYIRLRYHLLPYIYSVSWQVTSAGYTMMRPLIMDFRTDAQTHAIADQYLFGPALLACPVVQPGATSRDVYLPAGAGWIDFWTGKTYEGGQNIAATAPIQTMPLFVKAGSILPYGPALQYVSEKSADTLELRVYRGADGAFTLYEDEGDNYNYEKGAYATIPLTWNEQKQVLTIGERKGSYPGMLKGRTFRVVWVKPGHGAGVAPTEKADAEVRYDGKAATVSAPRQRI